MSQSSSPKKNGNAPAGSRNSYVVSRFAIIFFMTLLLAAGIAYKLVCTTTVQAEAWERMAASTLRDSQVVVPVRGEILASDGSILATNLHYSKVMIDFRASRFDIVHFHDTLPALCGELARLLPWRGDSAKWLERFKVQLDRPKSERTSNFIIAKSLPEETVDKIRKLPFFCKSKNPNVTGLKADRIVKRSYPFGEMAKMSIGQVGETTNKEIHGVTGLERELDTLLYGVPGLKRKKMFTRGARYAVETPAVNGFGVTTTIDITIQDILENELGQMLIDAKADWGTAMIMEVSTGDIKAMSNLERDSLSPEPRYIEALNRTVLAYEPGSVMKVMTMAVALEKGFAKPVTRELPIGRSFAYLGRKPINDTHSPGSLPVSRFIEYSSNIGMVKMSMPHYENDPNSFRADLADMGFFDRFRTGIARERTPYFPRLQNNVGGRLSLSRMVFGYSTMIPPLYTCAFYNTVANDGRFVRPRLVKSLRLPDGRDSAIDVSYVRDRILSSENAAILREMMHGVVWKEGGTAKALKSDIVEIAGKTGTCKIAREDTRPRKDKDGNPIKLTPFKGGYLEGHYRVTFCGFFPYENPKYTCIVVISDPKVPYRGPAVSSGTVLKNVALKMYARGMLEADPVFEDNRAAGTTPTVYASFNDRRNATLHADLRLDKASAIRRPASAAEGCVPDVCGVGIREALTTLESSGYAVSFQGIGYVAEQNPPAGTEAVPGTKVQLLLKHD